MFFLFCFALVCVNNSKCPTDLYSGDLQTTIILFIHNASFTDAFACFVLPFISQSKLFDECFWRRLTLPSRNLYQTKHVVYVIAVCVFCLSLQCCYCFLFILLFYTNVVSLFLFISCLIVFVAFVYHFNVKRCFHFRNSILRHTLIGAVIIGMYFFNKNDNPNITVNDY